MITKKQINISKSSTQKTYQRSVDLVGELVGIHCKNVSLTSDVKLDLYRSSSTHKTNRVGIIQIHGTTQIMIRPAFNGYVGGSTAWNKPQSTALAAWDKKMEFGDEPLVVVLSSAAAAKNTTLTATLTLYVRG